MSTRAAEILHALNNEIKHVPFEKINPFNKINQQVRAIVNEKQPKDIVASQLTSEILPERQSTNQKPNFNEQNKYQETKQAPQWLVEMLTKQIGVQVPEKTSQSVEGVLRQRQKSAFDSLMGDHNSYLQAMLDNKRRNDESNINAITNLMSARTNKVEGDLQQGKIEVNPHDPKLVSKKQIDLLQKFDLERMIKIKDGELRSKLDILNEKMASFQAVQSWQGPTASQQQVQQQLLKKIAEGMEAANFSLDSEKTKIARDYVRYMHQQRKLLEKRRKQRQNRYAQHSTERQNEMKEAMQMKDMAKRQEVLQRIEERRKKRQEEQKQLESKEEQVKAFLSQFHQRHPLFKLKQKQFQQRFVKPEQKLRQQKLVQIRQYRKSMSLNEIKTHQQKYLSKLQSDKAKRQQQFKLILKSRKVQDEMHPYYRGSAHKRIGQMTKEEQLRSYSLRQASKVKALRMKEYGDAILSKYQPRVDQDKKQQLMSLLEADMMKKKKAKKVYKQLVDQTTKQVKMVVQYQPLPQRDYRSEGNRYFDEAKKFIKKKSKEDDSIQKKDASQEKSPKSEKNKITLLQNSRAESENKSKSIWHLRAKQVQQLAGSNIVDAKNFEFVKHNIQNLDKKAAQKEQMMKKVDFTMQQHIEQKGNLDRFYLQSIKQKLKLLQ